MASGEPMNKPAEATVTLSHLEDKKQAKDEEFTGATLQIESETQNGRDSPEVGFASPALTRNRPGSVISRQSVRSTSSRTSMRPGVIKSEFISKQFFSYKDNAFQVAVDKASTIINPELDGELLGAWLLTEIDHWDLEREKLVLLTANSILVVKYNFISQQLQEYRRIMLHIINCILIGDFKYPPKSIMFDRQHGGIQLRWAQPADLTFGQRWNPWCTDIPWVTLAHHPILYDPKENETALYNVDEFFESLVQATNKVYESKRPGEKVKVVEGQIEIESYASITSVVYNQSGLGFFRDRNGLCF